MLSQPHFVDTLPDENEAQHLLNRNRLRLVRAGLASLSVALAIAVVGCAADVLAVYNRTTLPGEWGLQLFAKDMDTSPTKAALASGVIIAVASLGLLAASLAPRIYTRPTVLDIFAAGSAFICFVLAVGSLAHSGRFETRDDVTTMHSWTCRWRGVGKKSSADFNRICSVTKALHPLLITIVCVEALVLALTALASWMERRVKTLQGFRLESKGVDTAA